jgi:NAD+ kinase
MQVVIYGKALHNQDIEYVQSLVDLLFENNVTIYFYKDYYDEICTHIKLKNDVGFVNNFLDFKKNKFDFVITLGGDGTILNAITLIQDSNVPILGINLGRLGFMASINKQKIPYAVNCIINGLYSVEERNLLHLESNIPIFKDANFALNDFTILKRDTTSMITIHVYLNGAFLNSYWADGLIIATPTGSTGYSLSCGGPIVFPNSGNFVITPVAPHNLNVRPIIVSDKSVISFEIEGRADSFLCTLDSRFETITSDFQIAVRSSDFTIKLIQLQDETFLNTLREKLVWGKDYRN